MQRPLPTPGAAIGWWHCPLNCTALEDKEEKEGEEKAEEEEMQEASK
jgi:hypothetical protein